MTRSGWMLICAALAAMGCDPKGSLGNFTDTASDEGGSTEGATDGMGATNTGGGGEGEGDGGPKLDVGDGDDDDDDDDSDSSADDGIMLDVGGSDCDEGCAVDCGEIYQCGGLSRFDDFGCTRPNCSDDEDCGDGERCYYGEMFGECNSSGVFCSDDSGECTCGQDDDCGGRYCVPEEDYPPANPLPGSASRIDIGCAPNDGPAIEISLGLDDGSCMMPVPTSPPLQLVIYADPGTTGTWEIANPAASGTYFDGVASHPVTIGTVTIDEYAGFAAGSYGVVADTGTELVHLAGDFDLTEDCGSYIVCG